MADENPSIMNHVSIAVSDADRSYAFYDKVLATIGAKRIVEHPGAVAYGKMFPEFWVHPEPFDGGSPGPPSSTMTRSADTASAGSWVMWMVVT